MKAGFYPKIAWDGIRKNKRLYIPYILTGCVMVMMYYILSFMIESPALAQMPGGSVLMSLLPMGCGVIAVFSVLFLFYTNSFLIKQRYREFGLYNILGMKRNGAGLASICILLTMVLVMISSTTSLYFGEEDSVKNRCPNDVNIRATFDNIDGISNENLTMLREMIRSQGGEDADLTGVRACEVPGLITQDGITIDVDSHIDFSASTYNNVGYLSVISIDDYNNIMGTKESLADDECLVYCNRLPFEWDTFTMQHGDTYKVKEQLGDFPTDGDSEALIIPTVYLVVNDIYAFSEPIKDMKNNNGDPMMMFDWRCGFDVDTREEERDVTEKIKERFRTLDMENDERIYSYDIRSREAI